MLPFCPSPTAQACVNDLAGRQPELFLERQHIRCAFPRLFRQFIEFRNPPEISGAYSHQAGSPAIEDVQHVVTRGS